MTTLITRIQDQLFDKDRWARLMTGTPWDPEIVQNWDQTTNCSMNLDSWEILVIAIRPSC